MKILIKKALSSIVILLIISLLVFLAFQILPGNPIHVILGTNATPERTAQLSKELGLDKPLLERYLSLLSGLLRGNPGNSIKFQQPINLILSSRLPVTLSLGLFSLLFIVIITVPVGILGGKNYNNGFGKIILGTSAILTAIPSYFLSVIITIIFGVVFKLFQNGSFVYFHENPIQNLVYLFFPSLAIALPNAAMLIKFLSSAINEQSTQNYARTARSKGASELRVVFLHLFKNSILSTLTMFGMIVADLFCGSIVVEQIFNIPGIGRLFLSSISARDFPLLQVLTIFSASVIVTINFLVDILLTMMDPRIKIS